MLFNTYIDFLINSNPKLKKLAEEGKLLAYADEILKLGNNKKEAEETLQPFAEILIFGFKLNLKKTQIITNSLDTQGITVIIGVKIEKEINYLGATILC
jgi:hypothetical protein